MRCALSDALPYLAPPIAQQPVAVDGAMVRGVVERVCGEHFKQSAGIAKHIAHDLTAALAKQAAHHADDAP